jgi:hypothetical protein
VPDCCCGSELQLRAESDAELHFSEFHDELVDRGGAILLQLQYELKQRIAALNCQ